MKKLIIPVIIIVIIVFFCCTISSVIAAYFFSKALNKGIEVKNNRLIEICKESKPLDQKDYDIFFTERYKNKYTYLESLKLIHEMFPESYDCENLRSDGFIGTIKKNMGIYINTNNGVETISVTFTPDKTTYSVDLIQEDGDWKINSISTTDK